MTTARLADKPLLILISTGPQRYREYLFVSILSRYRIHLINIGAPTWECAYIVGSTEVASTDLDHVLPAACAVAAREPVAGVLSWDEARIHQAAQVAEALGLPTSPPDAVWRCRDKLASRQALGAAGVPQPRFEIVSSAEEALAAAARIGFPVVIKPRAAAASYGVVLVRNAADLHAQFGFTAVATVPHMPRYDHGVLVEEYLPGPEISVDCAVRAGRVTPLFIARKEVGFPPYFEETAHVVTHEDPLLRDQALASVLERTHAALGFTDGWTHTELKLTSAGPKVIEVNGRLGGDLIPYLGMRASGIDPGLVAAAIACGQKPDMTARHALVAAVRFFYVEHDDTVIESVGFDEEALPAEIDQAVSLAQPGTVVSPPPRGLVSGRIAFTTVVAGTAQRCRAALDEARAALSVTQASSPAAR